MRNFQLFTISVIFLRILHLYLKLLLYFCKRITYFIIMYGKERCKQIKDNVGGNQTFQ